MKISQIKKSALLLVLKGMITSSVVAQVSGSVFKDFNSNGTRENATESAFANVLVEATTSNGDVFTTSTDANGNYSFSSTQIPPGEDVRIHFPDLGGYYNGLKGAESKSNVIFTTGGDSQASLGVFSPKEYCEFDSPNILTSCYVNGDPLGGGSAGEDIALVTFPYNASGLANTTTDNQLNYVAKISDVGSVWGMSYQISTKRFLVSALARRHSGFGPLGTGGLYLVDDQLNNAIPYADLQSLGINTGNDNHSNLPADKLQISPDSLMVHDAGRVGIGAITLSEDEQTLYVVNLFEKKLHLLNVGVPIQASNPPTLVASYNIPDPSGIGDYVPWAVTEYRGEVYVGVVNTAETSQMRENMSAHVYKMNQNNGDFSEVLSFDLDYERGSSDKTGNCAQISKWNPWTDVFPQGCHRIFDSNYGKWVNFVMNPQPILSSITFDIDGSLIIGFKDRFGLQVGYRNSRPVDNGELYDGFVGGDLLRAQYDPFTNTFELEQNGVSGDLIGVGQGNGQGPGGGEFYGDDTWFFFGNPAHEEITNGGMLLIPGTGELMVSAMDPVNQVYQSGGIRTFDRKDGSMLRGYALYTDVPGTLGKSGGVGDFKLVCNAAPIELGNRIWLDENDDGVQDAGEPGIPQLIVEIYSKDDPTQLLATDTTDSEGTFCFNKLNLPSLDYREDYLIKTKLSTELIETYKVIGLSKMGAAAPDLDSDAFLDGDMACIEINSGFPGQVRHDIDFGFVPCIPPLLENVSRDTSICAGTNILDLPDAPAGASWSFASGPEVLPIDAQNGIINGLERPGKFTFYISDDVIDGCRDSINVFVKERPVVADSIAICFKENSVLLSANPTGGTWQQNNSNPFNLNISNNLVTGINESGTYLLTYDFEGCLDTTILVKNERVAAGDDASYCTFDENIQLNGLPAGGSWRAASENTLSVGISNDGQISSFPGSGDFKFIYDVENCSDTVTLFVLECAKACIGDFAWFDANNNGIQDSIIDPFDNSIVGPELPASGIKLFLFEAGNAEAIDSTVTDNFGLYKFPNLTPGNYSLKFDDASYPGENFIVVDKNVGNDPSIDNDFERGVYTSDPIALSVGEFDLSWDIGFNRSPEPTISDPCACNTEVIYLIADNEFGSDYIYNERVDVQGTPGSVWRIIEEDLSTGLRTRGIRLDLDGDGYPTPVDAIGMRLIEDSTNLGNFYFEFSHEEPDGYAMAVTNGTDTLSISNACSSIKEDYDKRLNSVCSFGDELILQTSFPTGTAKYYFLFDSTFAFNESINEAELIANAQEITSLNPTDYEPGSTVALYVQWLPNPALSEGKVKACEKSVFINVNFSADGSECLSSLGDQVWLDLNANGMYELGEPGVEGVEVVLCDSLGDPVLLNAFGNSISPKFTDASGFYMFDSLAPASYTVKFKLPEGYEFTKSNEGTDDNSDSDADSTGVTELYTLTNGEMNFSIDAGLIPLGEIGNFVWYDSNNNGIQDLGESGVPGVELELFEMSDTGFPLRTIATTVTNDQGLYLFERVPSGRYKVLLVHGSLPLDYELTNNVNVGNDDSIDSDFDSLFRMSDDIVIDVTDVNMRTNYTIDAGIFKACPQRCIPISVSKSR